MSANGLPDFDIPIMCAKCAQTWGANPYLGMHPQACIYQFGYESLDQVWKVFFCCDERAALFLDKLGMIGETVKLVWRREPSKENQQQEA